MTTVPTQSEPNAAPFAQQPLRLECVAGPRADAVSSGWLTLDPADAPAVIGRGSGASHHLADPQISRQHAELRCVAGSWLLVDAGSRHGTLLNGNRLEAGRGAPLHTDDLIGIGPWTLRVSDGRGVSTILTESDADGASRVEPEVVPPSSMQSLAQQRLDLLMAAAEDMGGASTEAELASVLARAAVDGTGFARAAVVRPVSDGHEQLALAEGAGTGGDANPPALSRSLLDRAARGEFVSLGAGHAAGQPGSRFGGEEGATVPGGYGESVLSLGIHSALCAPIFVGEQVAGMLYLDARGRESRVQYDAAAMCRGLAGLAGLALAGQRRARLEQAQRRLEEDLHAAHAAQRLMHPAPDAGFGAVQVAVRAVPGRYVAGDLVDAFEVGGGRVAVLLGDVAGKGAGAGVIMAAAQSRLRTLLERGVSVTESLSSCNAALARGAPEGSFVTLFIAVIDPEACEIEYADAGHGYWLVRAPDGGVFRGTDPSDTTDRAGGVPLGIDPTAAYQSGRLAFAPGSRLAVMSDGVAEQRGSAEMFGFDRAIDAISQGDAKQSADGVMEALRSFAGGEAFGDDVTVLVADLSN